MICDDNGGRSWCRSPAEHTVANFRDLAVRRIGPSATSGACAQLEATMSPRVCAEHVEASPHTSGRPSGRYIWVRHRQRRRASRTQ
eukprot:2246663-Prymnesium_polylepis.1